MTSSMQLEGITSEHLSCPYGFRGMNVPVKMSTGPMEVNGPWGRGFTLIRAEIHDHRSAAQLKVLIV